MAVKRMELGSRFSSDGGQIFIIVKAVQRIKRGELCCWANRRYHTVRRIRKTPKRAALSDMKRSAGFVMAHPALKKNHCGFISDVGRLKMLVKL